MKRIIFAAFVVLVSGCNRPVAPEVQSSSQLQSDQAYNNVAADVAMLSDKIKQSVGYRLANIEANQTLPVLDYRVKDTMISVHDASIFFSASEEDIAVIATGAVQEARKRGKNLTAIQLMDGAVEEFVSRGIKNAKLGYFELYCAATLKK